jgi:CRP/FNR family transcriptional regulator
MDTILKIAKKKCDCFSCELRDVAFANLSQEDIDRICGAKEEKKYSRGEIINEEGEPVHDFKYLKNGLVKLFRKSVRGEEQIIAIARPLEFVSNTNVFTEGQYRYSLSALEDSVACCIRIGLMKEPIEKTEICAESYFSPLTDV